MKFRYLGRTGLLVSELTLGTMTFGAKGWGCDKNEAHAMLAAYLEAGGNLIDTADVYAEGETENIIGEFLQSVDRSSFILASKCGFPFGSDVNGLGLSRRHIIRSVEASLKRCAPTTSIFFICIDPIPARPQTRYLKPFRPSFSRGRCCILRSAIFRRGGSRSFRLRRRREKWLASPAASSCITWSIGTASRRSFPRWLTRESVFSPGARSPEAC